MNKNKIWYLVPWINSRVIIYYPNSLGTCNVTVPFRPDKPIKQIYGKCTLKTVKILGGNKLVQHLKFLDLFSGIGGFRQGMEACGNKCVGWCDINKFARKSYLAMYSHARREWNAKDITTVKNSKWRKVDQKYGKINVICGGFPCQSFSVAGKRKGFLDKTRGTLFFQIARAAKEIKPQYLFLENVKGLLNHRHGKTFATILSTLDEIGYDAEWHVFNSKYFGVPQNRERVYIIGHLRGSCTSEVFHQSKSVKENSEKLKYYHKSKHMNNRVLKKNGVSFSVRAKGHSPKVAIPVLTPDRVHKRQNGRRFKCNQDPMFTLTAEDRDGVGLNKNGKFIVRKLTPRECWRLQGFSDSLFDKAKRVNSNIHIIV